MLSPIRFLRHTLILLACCDPPPPLGRSCQGGIEIERLHRHLAVLRPVNAQDVKRLACMRIDKGGILRS